MPSLVAFLRLAAATVGVVARMDALARLGEEERRQAEALRQPASSQGSAELIGNNAQHRGLVEEIGIVALSDLTLLITGETGVGKVVEVVSPF